MGEWCKENWKAVALIVGMIVCMVACAAVTAVCPVAGAILIELSKAFLIGQLIGGGLAAGLTALQGGSFKEIAESYFDGAFLGGYGTLIACLMMTPLSYLTLDGAVAIGGVSAGLPQTLSYYGDRFFKGEEISDKEIVIGSAKAALHGAISAGILYVLYNGIDFRGRGGDTAKGNTDALDDTLKDGTGSVDDGIKGGSRTVNGFDTTVNAGKQGKHIVGHNNYIEGRSIFQGTVDDAQRLVNEFGGTGEWIGTNKERVDFGQVIGQYVNPVTGEAVDTTVGIIHYSNTGTHIVPALPIQ